MKRRQRMKSFRLYLREPVVVPSRHRQDYSLEEQGQLYDAFQKVTNQYRWHGRVAAFGQIGFFGSILLGILLREPVLLCVAGICPFIIVGAALTSPRLICPGCGNQLDQIGGYCPECGGNSIKRGSWFRFPQCLTCGKTFVVGRGGKNYKIRVCTHCGVILDQKGL